MLIYDKFNVFRKSISHLFYAKSRSFTKIIYEKSDSFEKPFDTQYPEHYLNVASIYVHWPYCKRRCHFCNFNKYIDSNVNHRRMRECLVKEVETLIYESGIKKISSVFFGGGTPNLAKPKTIEAVLGAISGLAELKNDVEVTMEVNPISSYSNQLKDFKEVGINRVSVGVQALSDRSLYHLGRDHSVQDALNTLKEAKNLFPHRTSVDILFGIPGQTLDSWNDTLNKMIPLLDDHVSVYQLTLERGTKLFKMCQERQTTLPGENVLADMYDITLEKLHISGFSAYEISNYSRSPETRSVHNQVYWTGKQYIGIGPGAHSRFVPQNSVSSRNDALTVSSMIRPGLREARIQTMEPIPWMKEVESFGHGTRIRKPQRKRDVLSELLSTGLRTIDGVTEEDWKHLCNEVPSLSQCFGNSSKTNWIFECNLLKSSPNGIKATQRGWKVLDHLIPYLLDELDDVFNEKLT